MARTEFSRSNKHNESIVDNSSGLQAGRPSHVYIGIVREVTDSYTMGRIRVEIPELGSQSDRNDSWFLVDYVSPFAGVTNIAETRKDGVQESDGQQSYGWWFPTVDIGNEVLVAFVNGNLSRGVWFGCIFQQNMNSMVPGSPSTATFQDTYPGGVPKPATEYPKRNTENNPDNTSRPVLKKLSDALAQQGLWNDTARGVSNASARRESPSKVQGMRTKSGWQWVFDEGDINNYMRFRGPNGTQVLLNETYGFIYIINRDGTVWIEMQQDGNLDVYAKQSINFHSELDFNVRADRDVNIEAGRNVNMKAVGTTSPGPGAGPGNINMEAATDLNMYTGSSIKETTEQIHRYATDLIHDFAGNTINQEASTHINQNAATIDHNTSSAGESSPAEQNILNDHPDNRKVTSSNNSRVPEHEPWQTHNIFEPDTQLSVPELKAGAGKPPSRAASSQPISNQDAFAPDPPPQPSPAAPTPQNEQAPAGTPPPGTPEEEIVEEENKTKCFCGDLRPISSFSLNDEAYLFLIKNKNFHPFAKPNPRIPGRFSYGYFNSVPQEYVDRFPQGLTENEALEEFARVYDGYARTVKASGITTPISFKMFVALVRLFSAVGEIPDELISVLNKIKDQTKSNNRNCQEAKKLWKSYRSPSDPLVSRLDVENSEKSVTNRIEEIRYAFECKSPFPENQNLRFFRDQQYRSAPTDAAREHAALASTDAQKRQIEFSLFRMGYDIYNPLSNISREFLFGTNFKNEVFTEIGRKPPEYDAPLETVNPNEEDIFALTIFGEAGGDSDNEKIAVANVIMNRFNYLNELVRGGDKVLNQWSDYPITISGICKRKTHRNYGQFACWNDPEYGGVRLIQGGKPSEKVKELLLGRHKKSMERSVEIAREAISGNLNDITEEATYYYLTDGNYNTETERPRWVELGVISGDADITAEIGRRTFLKSASGGYIST